MQQGWACASTANTESAGILKSIGIRAFQNSPPHSGNPMDLVKYLRNLTRSPIHRDRCISGRPLQIWQPSRYRGTRCFQSRSEIHRNRWIPERPSRALSEIDQGSPGVGGDFRTYRWVGQYLDFYMYGNLPPPPGCLDQSLIARDWAVPESIDFDGFQIASEK